MSNSAGTGPVGVNGADGAGVGTRRPAPYRRSEDLVERCVIGRRLLHLDEHRERAIDWERAAMLTTRVAIPSQFSHVCR